MRMDTVGESTRMDNSLDGLCTYIMYLYLCVLSNEVYHEKWKKKVAMPG